MSLDNENKRERALHARGGRAQSRQDRQGGPEIVDHGASQEVVYMGRMPDKLK